MIVPMHKVFCAARAADRERLLTVLGTAGVVHIEPVDPARAMGDEALQRQIELLDKALMLLAEASQCEKPLENPPSPIDAARETLELHGHRHELEQKVRENRAHIERLGPWGRVSLNDLAALDAADAELRLYEVKNEDLPKLDAICYTVVRENRSRSVVAMIARTDDDPTVPEEAEQIPRPAEDLKQLEDGIAAAQQEIEQIDHQLGRLCHLRDAMAETREDLLNRQRWEQAERSGTDEDPDLFALQGWIPEDEITTLKERMAQSDIPNALTTRPPRQDERPPTLVRYPWWAKPIQGLFSILGTVAGYREKDVSPLFIIALPLFAAILISDAGYGALLLALTLALRKKMEKPMVHLAVIIGVATLIWGVVVNAFFGFPIYGESLDDALIPVNMSDSSRSFMMRVSFWIAAVHLSLAWLWQAVTFYPSQKALAPFGWALAVWGMLGVVLTLLLKDPFGWNTPYPYLLITGVSLAVLFHNPDPNPIKRVLYGLGSVPLEILGKFSDEISYVRLMAVGLASSVLAVSFNEMAAETGVIQPVVLVLAHLLNFALAMIALFAHGVRLNMLEFSNNLGMEWSGYAYDPLDVKKRPGAEAAD